MTERNSTEKTGSAEPCEKAVQEKKPMFTNVTDTLRKIDSTPSSPTEDKTPRQIPVDLIEEESMESFPASDPPGHHQSNTDRVDPKRAGQK